MALQTEAGHVRMMRKRLQMDTAGPAPPEKRTLPGRRCMTGNWSRKSSVMPGWSRHLKPELCRKKRMERLQKMVSRYLGNMCIRREKQRKSIWNSASDSKERNTQSIFMRFLWKESGLR